MRECGYRLVIRNGFFYKVFDILGLNLLNDFYKILYEEIDIVWCLCCIYLGFYVIVLVIFGIERILSEDLNMIKKLDDFFGVSVFKYMIIVIFKIFDENVLNRMISEVFDVVDLKFKCKNRVLLFGIKIDELFFVECMKKFDDIFIKLIKDNVFKGNEYYIYKCYEKVMMIFEKDKDDYIKKNLKVIEEEVLENVRIEVV